MLQWIIEVIVVRTAQDHLLSISKIYMTRRYNYSAFFLVTYRIMC